MDNNSRLILPYELPENLESLYKHEEEIRKQSIFEINKDPKLVDHLEIVYASLDIINLNMAYKNQTDDELTIQFLGTRLFNSVVSSLKMLLAGYYQISFMVQRDILETGFLLDFFSIDPSKIPDWKNSSSEERYKKYSPSVIRKALDDRDGFKRRKRGQTYQQMCEYATHPTYIGFRLLAPERSVKIGPFFSLKYLTSALEGLAMYVPNFTVIYTSHFVEHLHFGLPRESLKPFLEADMDYMDRIKTWCGKYSGVVDLSRFSTDDIRKLLEQYPGNS